MKKSFPISSLRKFDSFLLESGAGERDTEGQLIQAGFVSLFARGCRWKAEDYEVEDWGAR